MGDKAAERTTGTLLRLAGWFCSIWLVFAVPAAVLLAALDTSNPSVHHWWQRLFAGLFLTALPAAVVTANHRREDAATLLGIVTGPTRSGDGGGGPQSYRGVFRRGWVVWTAWPRAVLTVEETGITLELRSITWAAVAPIHATWNQVEEVKRFTGFAAGLEFTLREQRFLFVCGPLTERRLMADLERRIPDRLAWRDPVGA